MDPTDASSIANGRGRPQQSQPQPQPQHRQNGTPQQPFGFGLHYPNGNASMMGAAGVPNLNLNPNLPVPQMPAVRLPFDSVLAHIPPPNHQYQSQHQPQNHQHQPQLTLQRLQQELSIMQRHQQPQSEPQRLQQVMSILQRHQLPRSIEQRLQLVQSILQWQEHPQSTLQRHQQTPSILQRLKSILQGRQQPQSEPQRHQQPPSTLQRHQQPQSTLHRQQQPQSVPQLQQQRNRSPGVSAAPTVGSEMTTKKRARSPEPDGNNLGLSLNDLQMAEGFSGENELSERHVREISLAKRQRRGRPPLSKTKRPGGAAGRAGVTFHNVVVQEGENIVSRLLELCRGHRTIFVAAATGSVRNVYFPQPDGGTVYHEGKFGIAAMTGSSSFVGGSQNSSTLNLTVMLAGPDNSISGGSVSGELIAASSVQMVIGSFIAESNQPNTSPIPTSAPRIGGSDQASSSSQDDACSITNKS